MACSLERIDIPNIYAVLRPDKQVPRISLVVKEEIEQVLVPHTEKRFQQYQETPFGNGVRRTALRLDCMSADAAALMNGTYDRDLAQLSDEARAWLSTLKTNNFVSAEGVISTNLTPEEWVNGWAKMRESTSLAPGGHYGHFKTAAVVARLSDDHPDQTVALAEIYAGMASLPLKHGFAPKQWQSCIDAILEKHRVN